MRAARLVEAGVLQLVEEEIPAVEKDKVLVKIDYCGVCGSDLHAYKKAKGYEFVQEKVILGHEFSGTIVAVGNLQQQHLIGRSIVVESQHYCGTCEYCIQQNFTLCVNRKVIGLHYDGGMAEYALVPLQNIILLEEEMTNSAIALAEPISVGVHALKKVEGEWADKNILIQGPGVIGFFIGLLCKEKGANVWISGLQEDYENRLKRFEVFNLNTFVQGQPLPFKKIDVLIECSGSSQAIFTNTSHLIKGGTILLVALYEQASEVYFTPIIRNEWCIKTSYGSNPEDYKEAIDLIRKYNNELQSLLTFYGLENINDAFKASIEKQVLKAIVKF